MEVRESRRQRQLRLERVRTAAQGPGGSNHDPIFGGANNSVRIVQAIPNVEFRAEVKFDSLPTSKYQSRGLLIEQDSANYLRFHFGFGNSLDVNASKILSHAQTIQFSSAISVPSGTTALWLRVQRNGNNWTLSWSPNGSSYNTVGTFTQSLTVASIAPFAGNYNATASAAPAFAVRIDAFIAGP